MGEAWQSMLDYLSSEDAWSGERGLPSLLLAQVKLSFAALLVASLIALPIAAVLGHLRRGGVVAVSIANIGRALPSYGIVAMMFPVSLAWGFGIGFWPIAVTLVLLAIPPIFTNTYTGVRDVPADVVEAARGMGMRAGQVLRRVEVPVALPLIVTGLRVSAVQVIATGTLGAIVGYRCLGTPIYSGIDLPKRLKGPMLAAALTVILLALTVSGLFALAQRLLVRGRRRPGPGADVTLQEVEADAPAAPAASLELAN
jgi:osmoprotectant transport system permease protein